MAQARETAAWNRDAQIIFYLAELVRAKMDPKKHPKPRELSDIHPYIDKEKPLPVPITALKALIKKKRK